MWQVIYVATTKSEALTIEDKLTAKGFLIKIDQTEGGYQIKVPESEANEVYEHFNDL